MSFWSNKSLVEVCSFFRSSIWSPFPLWSNTAQRAQPYFSWSVITMHGEIDPDLAFALSCPWSVGCCFRRTVGWPVKMNSSQPNSQCGFHSNVVSLAWKKTFFCLHWLAFWVCEWWRTPSVLRPSVQTEVLLTLPYLQRFTFGEEDSQDMNRNSPCLTTPALPGYFLS